MTFDAYLTTPFKKQFKMLKIILSFFFFIFNFHSPVFVQLNDKSTETTNNKKLEWGKISQADFDMKVYPLDSSAEAVVLDDYGSMELGTDLPTFIYFKRHKRIKLFKKSAFESEGLVKIRYYESDFDHRVSFDVLKAQIIYPDGHTYVLKEPDFLSEKISDKSFYKKILFPALQEGCILEYEYEMGSKFTGRMKEWYFQQSIPTRYSDFTVSVPEFYGFVWARHGAHLVEELPMENTIVSANVSAYSNRIKINNRHFVSKFVPAVKPDVFITTMNDYITSYNFQLAQYAYPGEGVKNYLKDWDGFSHDLYNENFGNFTRKSNYSDAWKDIKDIVSSLTTDSAKIEAIHSFVKNKMDWNDEKEFFPQESLNKAYKQKKGSSADMNLLLVALLNEAGIKTRPVILGTRSYGKAIESYPIIDDYNYVLAYTERDGKPIFLDATDPLLPVNMPRLDALNGRGCVLDKKKPYWIDIVAPGSTIQRVVNFELDGERAISGNLLSVYKGYDALIERHLAGNVEELEKATKKHFTELAPDIQIDSISKTNLRELNEPYKTNVHFKLTDAAGNTGNVFYINPTLFADYKENPFKQKERNYPVDIPYKQSRQYVLNFKIPPGYEVSDLPKNIKLVLPDNAASFQYVITNTGNIIQASVKLNINQLQYAAENYSTLKEFFDQVAAKQNEQVVLIKK